MPRFHLLLIVGLSGWCSARSSAVEIAPLRYPIHSHSAAYIPYASNHSLEKSDPRITRVLFSIHSSSFDALQYLKNAVTAASQVDGVAEETLIVAPQFFQLDVLPDEIPNGLLFWRSPPFRGSSRAAIGPGVEYVALSAYEVIDQWLQQLIEGGRFANVSEVVFVGHSAGGQLVQRYAMVGKYQPEGIAFRYVVSAPSSYAYPSGERYDLGTGRFVVPTDAAIKSCPGYNKWGYGLESPYRYFSDLDSSAIAQNYADRQMFYLCGQKDINPNDPSLGKHCGAMLQGANRLQRMLWFEEFLKFKYGKTVLHKHRFSVVAEVGHHGFGTMNSSVGVQAMFGAIHQN